jgi:hypothetical protein
MGPMTLGADQAVSQRLKPGFAMIRARPLPDTVARGIERPP